jgi:murein L,D-transpeptidase YcbB/YkuD
MNITFNKSQKFFFLLFLLPFCFSLLTLTSCNKKKSDLESKYHLSFEKTVFSNVLKSRFDAGSDSFRVCHNNIPNFDSLAFYYQKNNFEPIWAKDLTSSESAFTILKYIKEAKYHGLNPEFYKFSLTTGLINDFYYSMQKSKIDYKTLADIEMLLSDAVIGYSSDLQYGMVNPQKLDTGGYTLPVKNRNATSLFEPLKAENIGEYLAKIQPKTNRYISLQNHLKEYYEIEKKGGWEKIPNIAKSITKGDTSKLLDKIAKRLLVSKELDKKNANTKFSVYDSSLIKAVMKFQERNGLLPTGIIDNNLVLKMNIPISDRISQITYNLERCRWLDYSDTARYIQNNLAAFEFKLFENKEVKLKMKICCGMKRERDYDKKLVVFRKSHRREDEPKNHETPTMTSIVEYLILNPKWNVPGRIAQDEMLWQIKKDSNYLAKRNYKVYLKDSLMDPSKINWKQYRPEHMPFKFVQDAGDDNSLGKIKFMFNNRFNIYMHDTPNKKAFLYANRAVSHGCMRLEKPLELAEYLIKDNRNYTIDDILIEIGQTPKDKTKLNRYRIRQEQFKNNKSMRTTSTVMLKKKIRLFVNYITCWVDEGDVLQFRDDVYEKDKLIKDVFNKRLNFYKYDKVVKRK